MTKLKLVLLLMTLIVSTSVSGCAFTRLDNIPDRPVKTHVFVGVNGMYCLINNNVDEYYLWKEEVEDYFDYIEVYKKRR